MVRLTWIGGPSFVLDIGGFRALCDLVYRDVFDMGGDRVIRLDTRPDVDASGADVICVSSARPDHYDRDAIAAAGVERVLAPEGLPGEPMAWFDATTLEKTGATLEIIALPATTTRADEAGNGYFFRYQAEDRLYTVYWTGDTRFSEHTRRIQRELGYANLLVVHLGCENSAATSADAKEAMQIVYRMQPNVVVPVHHSTFSHYSEPVSAFAKRAGVTIYEKRLHVLSEGQSVEKKIPPGR